MNTASEVHSKFIVSLLLHAVVICCMGCLWARYSASAIPVFQSGEFSLEIGAALPAAPSVSVAALPPPAPEPPPADIETDPEQPLEIAEAPEEEPGEMPIASEPASAPLPPPAPVTAAAAPVSGAASPGLAGMPQLDSGIHPVYPPGARRRGEEGNVTVRAAVTAAGKAQSAEVVSSSGYPALDQAALNAVRRARFIPARNGHVPVDAQTTLAFRFTLVD